MKRVMRELVRRKQINARTDVVKIKELTAGHHKKHLTSKHTPPFIWSLRHQRRYDKQ